MVEAKTVCGKHTFSGGVEQSQAGTNSRICVAELTVQLPEEKQGLVRVINRPESSSSIG